MKKNAEEILSGLPQIIYESPRFKHRLEYAVFLCFCYFFRILPGPAGMSLAFAMARLARALLPSYNRRCLAQIREALGVGDREASYILASAYRVLAGNWWRLARMDMEARRASEAGGEARGLTVEGDAPLGRAKEEGRGVVIATCHFHHWEAGTMLTSRAGYPSAVMAAVQHNPLVDRFINRQRESGGGRIVHNRLGVRHCLALLRAGGRLVIVSDVDVGNQGIFAPFLGRPASTPRWPAELAVRTGALLVVGTIRPAAGGGDLMRFETPLSASDFPGGEEEKILAMTSRMNDQISAIIRQDPSGWFWLQRRWKTRMAAAPAGKPDE